MTDSEEAGGLFDTNGLALTLSLPPIHPKTRLSTPLHLPTLPRKISYGKAPAHRGWGYCVSTERRGRLGGTFVQGIHSTSSINQPTFVLFFSRPRRRRRRRHRVTAAIESPLPSTHRHSVRWQTPDDERRVVALSPPSGENVLLTR